jgi:uncharacterized protein DUF6529
MRELAWAERRRSRRNWTAHPGRPIARMETQSKRIRRPRLRRGTEGSELTITTASPVSTSNRSVRWLIAPAAIFAAAALTVGLLARGHQEHQGGVTLFFSSQFHLMTWLSMVALGLACCQLFTAAWIYRKLPWPQPRRIHELHRWTGRLAILFVLPVLYWCIFQLGFQTFNSRVLAHSVLGTLFVGAVAGKITIVRLRRFPAWAYLLAGLLVFVTLVGAWGTSALWFVRQAGNSLF